VSLETRMKEGGFRTYTAVNYAFELGSWKNLNMSRLQHGDSEVFTSPKTKGPSAHPSSLGPPLSSLASVSAELISAVSLSTDQAMTPRLPGHSTTYHNSEHNRIEVHIYRHPR
jgi:hypothetical protein